MPVTAKLSRLFYEKLGDEVANELVDWFNTVDLNYRREFRELFEAHFGRLEARLAQQSAELRSDFEVRLQRLETTLIRWMFGFWIGAWVSIAVTVLAVQHLR